MPKELHNTRESIVDQMFGNPGQAQPWIGFKTHEGIAEALFMNFERHNPDLPGLGMALHRWFDLAPNEYAFSTGGIRRNGDIILVSCERAVSAKVSDRPGRRRPVRSHGTPETEDVTLEFTIAELLPEITVAATVEE